MAESTEQNSLTIGANNSRVGIKDVVSRISTNDPVDIKLHSLEPG